MRNSVVNRTGSAMASTGPSARAAAAAPLPGAPLPCAPDLERALCALAELRHVPTDVLALVACFADNGFVPRRVRFNAARCGPDLTVSDEGRCVTHAEATNGWHTVCCVATAACVCVERSDTVEKKKKQADY